MVRLSSLCLFGGGRGLRVFSVSLHHLLSEIGLVRGDAKSDDEDELKGRRVKEESVSITIHHSESNSV